MVGSQPRFAGAEDRFRSNARSIELVLAQVHIVHDDMLAALLRWLDPEHIGDQEATTARLTEARGHLAAAITSLQEAARQLRPPESEGERVVPTALQGTSTPSPSDVSLLAEAGDAMAEKLERLARELRRRGYDDAPEVEEFIANWRRVR